jgi:hypothetical protein
MNVKKKANSQITTRKIFGIFLSGKRNVAAENVEAESDVGFLLALTDYYSWL